LATPHTLTHVGSLQKAETEQQEQEQKQQQQEEEELSELQQQLLTWYRKTCLVAGAGMAGSIWHWYASGRNKHTVFLPPRAQVLSPQVRGAVSTLHA
jgi:hypothetical protein